MINENDYNEIMTNWGGGCMGMMEIEPEEDIKRWCVQKTVTVLANADYYYTKREVDKLLENVTASGVTREECEQMINEAIASKADKSALDELAAQVSANTQSILNTYTKPEVNALLASYYTKVQTNGMFANYTKVDGTTLHLNADNIN